VVPAGKVFGKNNRLFVDPELNDAKSVFICDCISDVTFFINDNFCSGIVCCVPVSLKRIFDDESIMVPDASTLSMPNVRLPPITTSR